MVRCALFGMTALLLGLCRAESAWEELSVAPDAAHSSPLFVQSSAAGKVRLGLDRSIYRQLKSKAKALGEFSMKNFVKLPGADRHTVLLLKAFDVLNDDAVIEHVRTDGRVDRLAPPEMLHLHGTISGDPDSFVLLNLSPGGSTGVVHARDRRVSIERDPEGHSLMLEDGEPGKVHMGTAAGAKVVGPGPSGNGGASSNFLTGPSGNSGDDLEEKMDKYAAMQEQDNEDELVWNGPAKTLVAETEQLETRKPNKYVIDIAVECDQRCVARLNQYGPQTGQPGVTDAASYLKALVAGTAVIYKRDLGRDLGISFMRLWDKASPFDQGTNSLNQLRAHYNSNPPTQKFDVAHLFTGIQEGGVAYLKTVCRRGANVGVSSLRGMWKGTQQSSSFNWDLIVTAHELGHNFGSGHSHDYKPPIDECVACRQGFSEAQCLSGGQAVGPVSRNDARCVRGVSRLPGWPCAHRQGRQS